MKIVNTYIVLERGIYSPSVLRKVYELVNGDFIIVRDNLMSKITFEQFLEMQNDIFNK